MKARILAPENRKWLTLAAVAVGLFMIMLDNTVTFPPRERGTAIGIWAGTSAIALAIGPLVGGILTEKIGWNWIFFINIPVGAVGILAAYLFISESRDTSHEQRPDV